MTRTARQRVAILATIVLALGLPFTASGGGSAQPRWMTTALRQLGNLQTAPAGPMAGYSRAAFGRAWADVDGNHCNTRDDVLRRDLSKVVFADGSGCLITAGLLRDPYTGETIRFVRGVGTSTAVQIDHVVALAAAWRTGAAAWTAARRLQYANAPLVLLAVDGPANEAKGDDDASQWLPPRTAYDCRYVAKQISIKTRYKLWVTPAERVAMTTQLASCP